MSVPSQTGNCQAKINEMIHLQETPLIIHAISQKNHTQWNSDSQPVCHGPKVSCGKSNAKCKYENATNHIIV